MISCLRSAGVEVVERNEPVWSGRGQQWRSGLGTVARIAAAEARLLRRPAGRFDAVIVGYPGHVDLPAARRAARDAPVVFNPLISLADTLVSDRRRFPPGSLPARILEAVDRRALRAADLVVADTAANATFLAERAGLDLARVAVCFVGAEERLFAPGWSPAEPFTCLFVGRLIPLHGVETILSAARLAPAVRFRVIGSGQLRGLLADAPSNVEHVPWIEYEELPAEYHRAGCALGIFGTSPKATRVIPNKAFQALASGTPLVTADTPAARELLKDGESALLVAPGGAAALAEAVIGLSGDTALSETLAAGGLRAYRQQASEEVLGARWRTLVESLIR